MCLTVPKKVISVQGENIIIMRPDGKQQEIRSIVESKKGEYVLTQRNVAIQKIGKKEAEELLNLIKSYEE